ncbi:MAG: putative ABC transporter permease [Mogibacterium sp.]|nr:putative ABC transporter permease [Mogibacterium sp.]
MTVYQIFQFFLIYSFLGWCLEVVYHAVSKGIVVNRGFLNGPVCPIYGFGVIAIFGLLNLASEREMHEVNALGVFVGGVVLATIIELFGGWALDKLFHARWWDYSKEPFNFHGYICLRFSLFWGAGILLVVRGVHPMIADLAGRVPVKAGWILMGVLYLVYLADVVLSVMFMIGLNKKLSELETMRSDMRIVSDKLTAALGEGALEAAGSVDEARVQAALAREDLIEDFDEARAAFDQKREAFEQKRMALEEDLRKTRHFGTGRLLRAFPEMSHHDYGDLLLQYRDILKY